jgi:hypothetical protein
MNFIFVARFGSWAFDPSIMSYNLEIFNKTSKLGIVVPFSHFDTAYLDIPNSFAKSSCV